MDPVPDIAVEWVASPEEVVGGSPYANAPCGWHTTTVRDRGPVITAPGWKVVFSGEVSDNLANIAGETSDIPLSRSHTVAVMMEGAPADIVVDAADPKVGGRMLMLTSLGRYHNIASAGPVPSSAIVCFSTLTTYRRTEPTSEWRPTIHTRTTSAPREVVYA